MSVANVVSSIADVAVPAELIGPARPGRVEWPAAGPTRVSHLTKGQWIERHGQT